MIRSTIKMRHALFLLGVSGFLCAAQGHEDSMASLLLGLTILLPVAKVAGMAMQKLGQPAVLGELMFGMVLGNLSLVGVQGLDYLKTDPGLEMLAGLGVILLLFEVGLESSLADLLKVGVSSFLVATIGVLSPFGLGWIVSGWILSGRSPYVHAFIGATLCATSVGITARVLQDIKKINTREAKIILGAAVIDDVLGLVLLAIISGMILAASTGAALSVGLILRLITKVVLFLVGSLALGVLFIPRLLRQVAKFKVKGMLFTFALAFCFLLSYLATLISLAAIVGAFAAGLILERVPFDEYQHEDELSPEHMLHPISSFLVPLFFLQMGIKIDLTSLLRIDVLGLALALTAVGILGKQVCGLGALEKNLNRLAIGVGMVPRGEVGLIFAGVGLTLSVAGEKILDDATFAAILIMVMVTTFITPPVLQWTFSRRDKKG